LLHIEFFFQWYNFLSTWKNFFVNCGMKLANFFYFSSFFFRRRRLDSYGEVNPFTGGWEQVRERRKDRMYKERRKNNLSFYGDLLFPYCSFFSLKNPLFASKNNQSETKIPALKLVTYFFAVPKLFFAVPKTWKAAKLTEMVSMLARMSLFFNNCPPLNPKAPKGRNH